MAAKIPKLVDIGGFRLLDNTLTQADNATGGLAKEGKGKSG